MRGVAVWFAAGNRVPRSAALAGLIPVLLTAAGAALADEARRIDPADLGAYERRALFRAQGFLEEDRPERAVDVLRDVLADREAQELPALRMLLATGLARAGRTAAALEEFQRIASHYPGETQAWLRIGELAYELERYDESARGFLSAEQALRAELLEAGDDTVGTRPSLRYYAAVALLLGEQPQRALPLLEELVSGRWGAPRFEGFQSLILGALQYDAERDLAPVLQRMLALYADDPRVWRLASQHAMATGDYRRACAALTIAGYLAPLSRAEKLQLADLYATIDVPSAAAELYEEALGDSGSAAEYERLASAYLAAHHPAASLEALSRGIRATQSVQLQKLQGEIRYLQGDYRGAYEALRAVVERENEITGDARMLLLLGYSALELGRTREARRYLRAAAADSLHGEAAERLLQRLDGEVGSNPASR